MGRSIVRLLTGIWGKREAICSKSKLQIGIILKKEI